MSDLPEIRVPRQQGQIGVPSLAPFTLPVPGTGNSRRQFLFHQDEKTGEPLVIDMIRGGDDTPFPAGMQLGPLASQGDPREFVEQEMRRRMQETASRSLIGGRGIRDLSPAQSANAFQEALGTVTRDYAPKTADEVQFGRAQQMSQGQYAHELAKQQLVNQGHLDVARMNLKAIAPQFMGQLALRTDMTAGQQRDAIATFNALMRENAGDQLGLLPGGGGTATPGLPVPAGGGGGLPRVSVAGPVPSVGVPAGPMARQESLEDIAMRRQARPAEDEQKAFFDFIRGNDFSEEGLMKRLAANPKFTRDPGYLNLVMAALRGGPKGRTRQQQLDELEKLYVRHGREVLPAQQHQGGQLLPTEPLNLGGLTLRRMDQRSGTPGVQGVSSHDFEIADPEAGWWSRPSIPNYPGSQTFSGYSDLFPTWRQPTIDQYRDYASAIAPIIRAYRREILAEQAAQQAGQ